MNTINPRKIKVLHMMMVTFPVQSGYTLRTSHILKHIKAKNIQHYIVSNVYGLRLNLPAKKTICYKDNAIHIVLMNKFLKIFIKIGFAVPFIRLLFRYFLIIFNCFYYIARLKISKYDVVQGHSNFFNGLSAYFIALLYGKPFIYDIHALYFDRFNVENWRFRWEKYWELWLVNRAYGVFVTDEAVKTRLIELGIKNNNKIFIVPNGVDRQHFQKTAEEEQINLKKRLGIPEAKLIVGIDASKPVENITFFLEHQNQIIQKFSEIHWIVFNSKSAVNPVNEAFTFLPLITYAKMPAYLSILNAYIFNRLKNKQTDTVTPLKLLEVMAIELPILTSDVEGITNLVQKSDNCFVYKPNDILSFIEQLEKLVLFLKNKPISNQNKVKEIIESYSWNKSADICTDVYYSLMNK